MPANVSAALRAAAGDAKDEYERVRERLTRVRPTLSPTLGRAAAYMLDHPADVVTMSMREIARAANVAAPNFSRLAQRVGFAGYSGLRAVYRHRIHTGKPVGDSTPDHVAALEGADRRPEELWHQFRQTALGNLAATFENVDSALIAELADELRSRDRIYLAAAHASQHVARYLQSLGNMVAPSFRLIGRETGSVSDGLVDITGRDAVICLAAALPSGGTIRVAKLAQERGALIVGITESRTTPLAAISDRLLIVPVQSPSFFRSHVSALAIVEMLVGFIVLGAEQTATDRIERIEADRRRFADE